MTAAPRLFETVLVTDGRALRIREHLARLWSSAAALGVTLHDDPEEVRRRCDGPPDGRMKVAAENGFLEVTVTPFEGYPEELYAEGGVALLSESRGHPLGARAGHKSLPYDVMLEARARAEERGAIEMLFLDTDGALLEGSVTNLFLVSGGELLTPPLSRRILPGVTRAAVLALAPELDLRPRETDVFPADFARAEEAFLTSSLMLAMPLRRIGETALCPGPRAARLRSLLCSARG